MTVRIFDFPREWYKHDRGNDTSGGITSIKYRLRSMSQVATRPWIGGRSVSGPVAKMWMADVVMKAQKNPVIQDMRAFFSRIDGQAQAIRFADASRLSTWYDRNLKATSTKFSDGKGFTDGTGFADGYLPPEVAVESNAARGANYIVLTGFPASTANVLRHGDLLEVRPVGIAAAFPHLYEAQISGSSDSSGRVGVEISPRLRAGIAAGDVVSLRYASTVFRLVDDTQGEVEITHAGSDYGNYGFQLIEALDLVP